jgi:hypothetical protein
MKKSAVRSAHREMARVMTAAGAMALALLGWRCAAGPNARSLARFPETPNLSQDVQQGETCEVRACRLGDPCLKELFGNSKVGRSFVVFWIDLKPLSETPVQVTRNEIWVTWNNVKIFPVDPGRVAYVAKQGSLAGASLAFLFWPAALAAVDGVETANKRRLGVTGTNAFPDQMTIPPGSSLSGFLYFEPPLKKKTPMSGGLMLTVPIKTGDRQESVTLRGIPVVNPALPKEGKSDDNED